MTSIVSLCPDLGTVRYAYQENQGEVYAVHVPLESHLLIGHKANSWGYSLLHGREKWPQAIVTQFLQDFRRVCRIRQVLQQLERARYEYCPVPPAK